MNRVCVCVVLLFCLLAPVSLVAQDLVLGNIQFPLPFIHSQQEFSAGVYRLVLTVKEGTPYFSVYNSSDELLFEELAIVETSKAGKAGGRFSFRMAHGMLRGNEYFRVAVRRPEQKLLAFFLIKK